MQIQITIEIILLIGLFSIIATMIAFEIFQYFDGDTSLKDDDK